MTLNRNSENQPALGGVPQAETGAQRAFRNTSDDKLVAVILAFCIAAAICSAAISISASPSSTGAAHPELPAMRVAADNAAFFSVSAAWIVALQTACIFGSGAMLALSVNHTRRGVALYALLAAPISVLAISWGALIWLYTRYLQTGVVDYWFGLPAPSALVVIGPWAAIILLIAFYTTQFERFIFTADDAAAFDALLKEKAAKDGEGVA